MYNFAKLFSLLQQQTFALYNSHVYRERPTKIRIYRKQNTITTQSRDGFANETISRLVGNLALNKTTHGPDLPQYCLNSMKLDKLILGKNHLKLLPPDVVFQG